MSDFSRHQQSTVVAAWLIASALVHGCTRPLNSEIPVIEQDRSVATRSAEPTPSLRTDTLARDHWESTAVRWADGRVRHHPTYTSNLRLGSDPPRDHLQFPTVDSVSSDDRHPELDVAEGLLAAPHAVWTMAIAPIELLFGRWPWSTEAGAAGGYEQTPARTDAEFGVAAVPREPQRPAGGSSLPK